MLSHLYGFLQKQNSKLENVAQCATLFSRFEEVLARSCQLQELFTERSSFLCVIGICNP